MESPFKFVGRAMISIIETEDMGIILPDGTRLSARVWMPEDALENPVPAILEFLPYRKRDGTAIRDQKTHPYVAKHGYACVRVDMRGHGESEGLCDDEYSPQENQDAVDTINWIAAQPWCCGNVGMMGISWGGFNGLQTAALAPEPLKAVVTICSTTDRYADDVHYKGGVMLGENIGWAATATSWFSMPPDPKLVGDDWRDIWLRRLDNTPNLAKIWTQNQHRSAYWKHGSICEDFSSIKAAVLAVGGWHDGYRNTPAALIENLSAPAKAIMGPWNHKYPHMAAPGPQIGFLQEAIRWWDRWLKGIENGAEHDPQYSAWLMDSVAPKVSYDHRPGRWVTEPNWPSQKINNRKFALGMTEFGTGTLAGDWPADDFAIMAPNAPLCGEATGEYFPFGFGPGELPDDQRKDDALSACFDGHPLEQDTDILGAPTVTLRLSVDQPKAHVAIRLNDLRPDGTVAMITMGVLNLRHRNSREHPENMEVGKPTEVFVKLDQIAYRLPKGHRLRVAVSTSYWPFIWPEADPVTAIISGGHLGLPTRPPANGNEREFEPVKMADALPTEISGDVQESKTVSFDYATGEQVIEIKGNTPRTQDLTHGLFTGSDITETWRICRDNPATANVQMTWNREMGRDAWRVHTRFETNTSADAGNFYITQRLRAWEGQTLLFDRETQNTVPRK
jgi:putative CocE/NonD family hydrolase